MVALLGVDRATAEAVCALVSSGEAWVSTVNGGGQVAIGAETRSLDEVEVVARELGCRRTRRLAVDGAFHTPLHRATADALLPTLATIRFNSPAWPVITNHDARPVTSADGWPQRLTEHLVRPVLWSAGIERLVSMGAKRFVEVGPGQTLTGLIRRIAPELEAA
jgi:[acyl-carrier-protein] S-malonyltransferase